MTGSPPPELTRLLDADDPQSRDRSWQAFVGAHSRILLHTARDFGGDYDSAMDRYAYVLEALWTGVQPVPVPVEWKRGWGLEGSRVQAARTTGPGGTFGPRLAFSHGCPGDLVENERQSTGRTSSSQLVMLLLLPCYVRPVNGADSVLRCSP